MTQTILSMNYLPFLAPPSETKALPEEMTSCLGVFQNYCGYFWPKSLFAALIVSISRNWTCGVRTEQRLLPWQDQRGQGVTRLLRHVPIARRVNAREPRLWRLENF